MISKAIILLCLLDLFYEKGYFVCTTVCSQNINKQNVNIADETPSDYSFLSRYHYTKSKNYLKRRYRIRHWISMFIGTPCTFHSRSVPLFQPTQLNLICKPSWKIFPWFYQGFYQVFQSNLRQIGPLLSGIQTNRRPEIITLCI